VIAHDKCDAERKIIDMLLKNLRRLSILIHVIKEIACDDEKVRRTSRCLYDEGIEHRK